MPDCWTLGTNVKKMAGSALYGTLLESPTLWSEGLAVDLWVLRGFCHSAAATFFLGPLNLVGKQCHLLDTRAGCMANTPAREAQAYMALPLLC